MRPCARAAASEWPLAQPADVNSAIPSARSRRSRPPLPAPAHPAQQRFRSRAIGGADHAIALDPGTGIRDRGPALDGDPTRVNILRTPLHLDPIQGLMFFAPAFRPRSETIVLGPEAPDAPL